MATRTKVLNCPVDIITVESALDAAKSALSENKNFQIVTLNPEMIMRAQNDREFFEILSSSNLNITDGIGVRLALKFQNIETHRIRGIDFARALVGLAAEKRLPLGLLGAREDVILKAAENIKADHPDINIVYVQNGYFQDEDKIIDEIKRANPRILLVGLGSPKQEEIIKKLQNVLTSCVMIGVGGSFDVLSGYIQESPEIFRRLGLEWLYRTSLEPKRFKRIFPALPIFLIKCIIDTVKKKGYEN